MTDEATKAHPGPFDAFDKAEPDELIFTLLERDPVAPETILHWVDLTRRWARENLKDEDKLKAKLIQCTEAEFIAYRMRDRQQGKEGRHAPAIRAKYSGQTGAEELEEIKLKDQAKRLTTLLAEAAYSAGLAVEHMREHHGADPEMAEDLGKLQEAQAVIRMLSMRYSPHRKHYEEQGVLPLATTTQGDQQ